MIPSETLDEKIEELREVRERTRRIHFIELVATCLREMGVDPQQISQQKITPEEIANLISTHIHKREYDLKVALSGIRQVCKERDRLSQRDFFREG